LSLELNCQITKLKLISEFNNLVLHHIYAEYIIYFLYYIDTFTQSRVFASKIRHISKKHLDLPSEGQSDSGKTVTPILRPPCLFRKHSWHAPYKSEFTSNSIMQSKISAIAVDVTVANEVKISILRTRCDR